MIHHPPSAPLLAMDGPVPGASSVLLPPLHSASASLSGVPLTNGHNHHHRLGGGYPSAYPQQRHSPRLRDSPGSAAPPMMSSSLHQFPPAQQHQQMSGPSMVAPQPMATTSSFDPRNLEIKTRSVEQTLLPLVQQVVISELA